jgi:hypothetical protein
MARTILAVVLAAAFGAVAGMVGIHLPSQAKLDAQQARLDEMESRVGVLRAKNLELEDQLEGLRDRSEALVPVPDFEEEPMAEIDPVDGVPEEGDADPDLAASLIAGQAAMNELDRRQQEESRRREEWAQRRSEWRDRFQTGVAEFFDEQMARSNDPVEQERLLAMQEQAYYGMELMRAYREAETDEERDALREEMGAAFEDARSMVNEQQDAMLRESLEEQGITDKAQQDAIVESLKTSLDSPFFRIPPGGIPGIMGGPGRGRGGPPGGGRGRR